MGTSSKLIEEALFKLAWSYGYFELCTAIFGFSLNSRLTDFKLESRQAGGGMFGLKLTWKPLDGIMKSTSCPNLMIFVTHDAPKVQLEVKILEGISYLSVVVFGARSCVEQTYSSRTISVS